MADFDRDDNLNTELTIASPHAHLATPIDQLSSLLALRLVLSLGAKFNIRRDINDVMTLTARNLIWPVSIAQKVQKFLSHRCAEMPAWAGVAKLAPDEFIARHGAWNGTYDDTTLFY
ncbi:MAG: ATPase, partial [Betaproteobacteria bacterium]